MYLILLACLEATGRRPEAYGGAPVALPTEPKASARRCSSVQTRATPGLRIEKSRHQLFAETAISYGLKAIKR
jgi:hypothetical protein